MLKREEGEKNVAVNGEKEEVSGGGGGFYCRENVTK